VSRKPTRRDLHEAALSRAAVEIHIAIRRLWRSPHTGGMDRQNAVAAACLLAGLQIPKWESAP
jgi:hypothetical protein